MKDHMGKLIKLSDLIRISTTFLAIFAPMEANAADYRNRTGSDFPVCTARGKQPPIWRIIVFVASGPKCWLEGEPKLAIAPMPPPPPPLPAPPPEPAVRGEQRYVIYFLQDKLSLTPETRDRVLEAVDFARRNGAKSITITGHSDIFGSAGAKAELSEGRARAVAAIFLSRGFSQAALKVRWKGGSEPAVATDGEVHEPLNDRVAIIVTF